MILRLLNAQGIAGLAASLCLALLLVLQKGETRHWKKQSSQFEQLYREFILDHYKNPRRSRDRARRRQG